jgi:rod shape-determining protein MreC
MEFLLNRYRNVSVLVGVIFVQLLLLGFQIKTNQDIRLIRVWAVSAVMPLARLLGSVQSNTIGVATDYANLVGIRDENARLKKWLSDAKMENQFLKNQLGTAERVQALAAFQSQSMWRYRAARIIGNAGTGTSKVVFIDVGTNAGVGKDMAVVTPDGLVGRVIASYSTASQVLLITDPGFAAGVISQKGRVKGTLKGQGTSLSLVDYIPNEENIADGELFFTSGEDRVFPKGLHVGQVRSTRAGKMSFKEVVLTPSGMRQGLEEVLVILDATHQEIPQATDRPQAIHLLPPPPTDPNAIEATPRLGGNVTTEADILADKYKRIGEAQGHVFGQGGAPNFNLNPAPRAEPKPPAQ